MTNKPKNGEPNYKDARKVTLEIVKEPFWHNLNQLDAIRQFMMVEGSLAVLDNWNIKYLELRVDMRTGNFLIKEGNVQKSKFLKISRDK